VDQAKPQNKIIYGHKQECGDDSNMGGDVCLFDPLVPEVTVQVEEKRPTNITGIAAQPV
jgi:hypothetical protein